jgi:hypothetical protein
LNVGDTASLALFVNDFDGAFGAGSWPLGDWSGEHAWHLRARAVSIFSNTATLEVEWSRYDRSTLTGVAERESEVITLHQGQRAVLDLARSPSRGSQFVNVLVEIEAAYVGDPDYENSVLIHELWLVHEKGSEVLKKRTWRSTKPGETKTFDFEPVTFAPLGAGGGQDFVGSLRLLVEGDVTTSIQRDGSLSVELKANRTLDCGAGNVGRGTGVKSFHVKAGETVAVELPLPSGYCTMAAGVRSVGPLPPGLQNVDGRVRVNLGDYFQGSRTSLLITVRRMIIHAPVREYR